MGQKPDRRCRKATAHNQNAFGLHDRVQGRIELCRIQVAGRPFDVYDVGVEDLLWNVVGVGRC